MDNHAEGQNAAHAHKISVLDWPTPEQLMAARRARGEALRDMTVSLFRRLKRMLVWQVQTTPLGRAGARPAKMRAAGGR